MGNSVGLCVGGNVGCTVVSVGVLLGALTSIANVVGADVSRTWNVG